MSRKREFCLCGYEARSDHVIKHQKTCAAAKRIAELQNKLNQAESEMSFLKKFGGSPTDVAAEYEKQRQYYESKLEQKEEEVRKKDNEIRRLNDELRVSTLKQTVNNNTTNTTIRTAVKIFCPVFGTEPRVEKSIVADILRKCIHDCSNTVPEYIRAKYLSFNGCANVRLPSVRSEYIQVVGKDPSGNLIWENKEKESTIHSMTEKNLQELRDTYSKSISLGQIWNTWYRSQKLSDEKSPEFQKVKHKVESLLHK